MHPRDLPPVASDHRAEIQKKRMAEPKTEVHRAAPRLRAIVALLWMALAQPCLLGCSDSVLLRGYGESEHLSDEALERLDEAVFGVFPKGSSIPVDVSVSVVHKDHGVILRRMYGDADPEEAFLVASLSKVVASILLMRLHESGTLDLNGSIESFGFRRDDGKTSTSAQLLSNLSGVRCPRLRSSGSGWECQFDFDDDLDRCGRKIWSSHNSERLFLTPDRSFCYGGGQWQVAGAVAQAASGRSWRELFHETFVENCGLENSGFSNQFRKSDRSLGDWSVFPRGFVPFENSRNPNIEGGMFSTVSDYSKILLMFLREGRCDHGRVVSSRGVSLALEDRLGALGGEIGAGFSAEDLRAFGSGYGLGWWIKRSTGQRIVPGAYGSTAWISPEREYAVLLATKAGGVVGRKLFEAVDRELSVVMDGLD